ncbi:MAG: hypothetical protein P8175_07085 [Deltaproteobacteria bacterium]|jgi:hypothetical protein
MTKQNELGWITVGPVKRTLIEDYEASNRGRCLFCKMDDGGLFLEGAVWNDVPKDCYVWAFECSACGKAWREIIRIEEIEKK